MTYMHPRPTGRRAGFAGQAAAFLVLSVFIALLLPPPQAGAAPQPGRVIEVRRVIDGDTILTKDGEYIRYLGIDAPERGEPFSFKATEVNRALLRARPVTVVECRSEKRDSYGRTLAWVYAGGRLVNGELLRRGLARPLFIPPCGSEKRALMERLAWQARTQALGIWESVGGAAAAPEISPDNASAYIGTMVTVRGLVERVTETPRVLIIEFAGSGKEGGPPFKAVIFPGALRYFRAAGLDPGRLAGRVISVRGKPRIYRGGPEIILVDPGQVQVYDER